jgi:hypothetical protein
VDSEEGREQQEWTVKRAENNKRGLSEQERTVNRAEKQQERRNE